MAEAAKETMNDSKSVIDTQVNAAATHDEVRS